MKLNQLNRLNESDARIVATYLTDLTNHSFN
jgi:hypothetical protein